MFNKWGLKPNEPFLIIQGICEYSDAQGIYYTQEYQFWDNEYDLGNVPFYYNRYTKNTSWLLSGNSTLKIARINNLISLLWNIDLTNT